MTKFPIKRFTAAVLTALTVAGSALSAGAVTYATRQHSYNNNFNDVSRNDWFYDSVSEAYSYGIINGISATQYDPEGTLDLAACIKLACCVHELRNNGRITLTNGTKNWYDPYVTYALQNGIISEEYDNYYAPASRAQVAVIFSRLLTAEDERVNADAAENKPFADLTDSTMWYYSSVYKMYACGIMNGDQNGRFNPEGKIKRSEIAAVVVRMLDTDRRIGATPPSATTETPDTGTTDSDDTYTGEPWTLLLHGGSFDPVPFTGLTGFSVLYDRGDVSGYSLNCVNDVVISRDSLTFYLRKDVGMTALGIVRGWLNNAAAYIDGVRSDKTASEMKTILDSHVSLYINGKPAEIAALTINKVEGDIVYTFAFADRYKKDSVQSVVLACGELPADAMSAVTAAKDKAASYDDPVYTGETTLGSSVYTTAIEEIENDNYTSLFRRETDRFMILYGVEVSPTTGDVAYRLRFVYHDGSVQEVAREKLGNIRVNDSGTVLYYSIAGPDGSTMEYGVNISSNNTSNSGNTELKKDISGTLRGFNITLSGVDTSTIALMEGDGEIIFRGVYSDYSTAFSVVEINKDSYYTYYTRYLQADSHNRIFAERNGCYYAVVYSSSADERIREAAERVISSVITENAFDLVYYPAENVTNTSASTLIILKDVYETSLVCDPLLWVDDDTQPNGFRMDNPLEADETYRITADTEVIVLAMNHTPLLSTSYGEFRKQWKENPWQYWRMILEPATGNVTKLIQQYVP